MALPDSVKLTVGTGIVLAHSTHAPAAANNLGTRTDQIELTSLANAAYRQSNKIDFLANRAPLWGVSAAFEMAATPTAGNIIEIWLAPSNSATAADANPGGVSGVDSAYTGYSANADAAIKQAILIGSFVCTVQITTTVQKSLGFGLFTPPMRYGTIVVANKSGAAFHSSMVETSILLNPIEHQIQD